MLFDKHVEGDLYAFYSNGFLRDISISRSSATRALHSCAFSFGFLKTCNLNFYCQFPVSNSIRQLIVLLLYVNSFHEISCFNIFIISLIDLCEISGNAIMTASLSLPIFSFCSRQSYTVSHILLAGVLLNFFIIPLLNRFTCAM